MAFFATDGGILAIPNADIPMLKSVAPEVTQIPDLQMGQSLIQLSEDAGGHAVILPTSDIPLMSQVDPDHQVIAHGTPQGPQLVAQARTMQAPAGGSPAQNPIIEILTHNPNSPINRKPVALHKTPSGPVDVLPTEPLEANKPIVVQREIPAPKAPAIRKLGIGQPALPESALTTPEVTPTLAPPL